MKILHIIGNGFDLNLKIKTSYSHFYKHYELLETKNPNLLELKKEIISNKNNWSDLEIAFGKYTKHIKDLIKLDEIADDLRESLGDYLEEQENLFDFTKIDRKLLFDYLCFPEDSFPATDKTAIENYTTKFKNSGWIVDIFTFNYTRSIEKIIETVIPPNLPIGKHYNNNAITLRGIEHIHGYTDDMMVLGVNDISQVANTNFHKDLDALDQIVKLNANKTNKHNIDNLFKQRINESNLICIFGSSFGDTDIFWWEQIGNRLKAGIPILIYTRGEEISRRNYHKIGRIERRFRDYFLNKTSLTDAEKEKFKENIYIGVNTNMFNLLP